MNKYQVLSTLDHDQVRYEAGEQIEMSDEQAKPLLALGRVRNTVAGAAKDDQPEPGSSEQPAEGSEGGAVDQVVEKAPVQEPSPEVVEAPVTEKPAPKAPKKQVKA